MSNSRTEARFIGGPYDGETLTVDSPGPDIITVPDKHGMGEYHRDHLIVLADGIRIYHWGGARNEG